MGLVSFFNERIEKRRNQLIQKQICPDCSGRGFLEYGFEYVQIFDCPACGGSGKSSFE